MNATSSKLVAVRKGCKDIWNANMCEGARFGAFDIPFCPTTATSAPEQIVTWDDAKALYAKYQRIGKHDFREPSFVCFYIDDQKFDGPNGIWYNPQKALRVLRHFAGVITPDFSTYQDFPMPLKIYNIYRMRTMGFFFGKQGIPVINNVRWGTPETYCYCFEGLPQNSILAIGTNGGSPRKIADRTRFEAGLQELVLRVSPQSLIIYGSANFPCFERLKEQGISVRQYPGRTAQAFARRQHHE